MNEFIEQFLIEGRELVEQGVADLLALESTPRDRDRLDSVFRAFHTLKGSAGIVDFAAMGRGLGAAEDVLSRIRSGGEPVTAVLISDCLTCLDQVVQWLDELEATGDLPLDAEAAADAIEARFRQRAAPALDAAAHAPRDAVRIEGLAELAEPLFTSQLAMLAAMDGDGARGRLTSAGRVAVNALLSLGRAGDAAQVEKAFRESLANGNPQALAAAMKSLRSERAVREPSDLTQPAVPTQATTRIMRVAIERIDALVRLAGELTVAKNAIGHSAALAQEGGDPKALAAKLREQHALLERLVSGLQREALGIRVLPLRQVFQRFPRLVREIGAGLGKPVRLIIEGEDTEADKSIVEGLFEPLLHVVRNAIDHGIEPPAARTGAGKAALADLRLSAERVGDRIIVEVADDGRGVDVARVRQIAAERGVATSDQLSLLTDQDAVNLIFAPGFSTTSGVTDLSGRGVGMDAVRVAVEKLGGHAAVESRPGLGTKVRFSLPFTAIMARVMTVEAGGQMFGIPLDEVVETVRIGKERVFPVGAAQAFVLRDRALPLCDLAETLGLTRLESEAVDMTVVVANVAGQQCGLRVDRAAERMDVMLKPMDGLVAGMPGLAGTTLLGDGRVLIVLDIQELFV